MNAKERPVRDCTGGLSLLEDKTNLNGQNMIASSSKSHPQMPKAKEVNWLRMVLLAICASVAIVVLFAVLKPRDEASPSKEIKAKRSKTIATFPTVTDVEKETLEESTADVQTSTIQHDNLPPSKRIVEMISVVTNADGSVLERYRTADGKTRSRQSAPKPVFSNATDQLLATAISGAASGASMPPMPVMGNADEEFRKSLETDIVINEDDSDEVKALKQSVIDLREEMKQILEEGGSFEQALREHRDLVNHGVEMRNEATRMIQEFLDEGDADSAMEFLDKVNATLAQMGIEEVEMPLSREERREAIREQHRQNQQEAL